MRHRRAIAGLAVVAAVLTAVSPAAGLVAAVLPVALTADLVYRRRAVASQLRDLDLDAVTADVADALPARRLRADSRAEKSTSALIKTGATTVSSIGIAGLITQKGIGGIFYAIIYNVTAFINNLGDIAGQPFTELWTGLAGIIGAIMDPGLIVTGYQAAAADIPMFSILAPIAAAIITFGTVWVLYKAFRRMDLSPLSLILDKIPGR